MKSKMNDVSIDSLTEWIFEDWHFLKYQGKTYILSNDIKRELDKNTKALSQLKGK